jgi:hypothetical protein
MAVNRTFQSKEDVMLNTGNSSRTIAAVLLALFAATAAGSAAAESEFAKKHPRRHEVNHRLKHQDRRIHREVKEGEMSKGEAAKLHRKDRRIRREERGMASENGGHITRQEKRDLNQQENQVSRQIGN